MINNLKPINGGYEDQEGIFWKSKTAYICTGILPSCGCGCPESIGQYVKEMFLKHVKQSYSDDCSCWDNNDYDDLPVMFFLSWADREKYIEHGTTIRCSWMTEKGDELLNDLIEIESEELE